MPKKRLELGIAEAALVFAALGDPTRLALLRQLADRGPASISALSGEFGVTRQAISKHLQVLAIAGVIDGKRAGREHVWALHPERLAAAQRHLDVIARSWDDALGRLKKMLEDE